MICKTFKTLTIAAALVFCANANAQDCGCGSNTGMDYGYTSYGADMGNDCGRAISQTQAASLWSSYCTETCAIDSVGSSGCKLFGRRGGCGGGGGCLGGGGFGGGGGCLSGGLGGGSCGGGGGCKIGGKLRGLFGGGGGGFGGGGFGGGCGCNQGCFGYPSGGFGGGFGGGGRSGLFAGHGRRSGGCGSGCLSGGKLRGMFGGRRNAGGGIFSGGGNGCGCGDSGAYFNQAIGYEYGNAGMQSCVSGCATGCVDSGFVGQPMMGTMDSGCSSCNGGNPTTAQPTMDGQTMDANQNGGDAAGTILQDGANAAESATRELQGTLEGN